MNMLLVEDNRDHAELVMRALREHDVAHRVEHVWDGEAALDYLYRRGAYEDPEGSPRPHLILLDLRLPRVDGLEVLETVKGDSDLQRIPVVILSTSDADRDVAAAYLRHANSYLVKPVDFSRFMNMMNDLGFYWLVWNRQPT